LSSIGHIICFYHFYFIYFQYISERRQRDSREDHPRDRYDYSPCRRSDCSHTTDS